MSSFGFGAMAGLLGIVVFGVVARTGDTEIGLMELELLVESDALDLLFDSVGFTNRWSKHFLKKNRFLLVKFNDLFIL